MSTQHIQLVDQGQIVLAEAQVVDEGGYFGGTIDLRATPDPIRVLFDEFEEIVNGQMFAFLDEIQEKINSLRLKAVFDDGSEVPIEDLQVFPAAEDVSFRSAGVPLRTARPA
jgi:hypothetical protein